MQRVLVLNKHGEPMVPCHPARARKLLKSGRAKVYRRYPFTIIVTDREEFETQEIELKIDPGSRTTGFAIVGKFERDHEVLWAANLDHRGQQVVQKLEKRKQVRRSRRGRKTRYRQPRFSNRTRPRGWLPPSLQSRVDNVTVWAKRLVGLAPITSIEIETSKFDTQLMANPEISGIEYQQGELQGYEVREYLLEKFDRACVYCGAKDVPLQVEHLTPVARGGSNRVSNLGLACEPCNRKKGTMTAEEFGFPHLQKQAGESLRDAAAVNAIRYRIGDELKGLGLPVHFWSGSRTKMNRLQQGYDKDHWIDAACVGESGAQVKILGITPLTITATGRGSRQICSMSKHGFPRTEPKAAKRVHGFQTGDMVRLNKSTGSKQGVYEGKVVVRTRGYFDIVLASARRITAPWYQFTLLQRFDGYSYSLSSSIGYTLR